LKIEKTIWAGSLEERQELETVFLVREKSLAVARNGKPYMILKLMDRSGEVEGRVWDRVEEFDREFERDDFVLVRGKASLYLNKMQLVVQQLRRLEDSDVEIGDFLPVSEIPPEQLRERLRERIAGLENQHLRQLMEAFQADAEFLDGFLRAPAAKSMHHVCLGGLLEHSLSVADLADKMAGHYPAVDRDLLIVGALLHDVGKVVELNYRRAFDYSDAGKLLGHIVMGVEMVEARVRQLPGFPGPLAMHLKHLLLSHHGQYDYGSPKRPKTLEAIVLNFIDDLDSKVNGYQTMLAREAHNDSNWTSYQRMYERYFYKGPKPTAEVVSKVDAGVEPPTETPVPSVSAPAKRSAAKPAQGFTLGDQLKGKSLDLFSAPEED